MTDRDALRGKSYREPGIAAYRELSMTVQLAIDDDAQRAGALTRQGSVKIEVGGLPVAPLTAAEARKLGRALIDAAEELDPILPQAAEPGDEARS